MNLRPYQQKGVEWLVPKRHALLADEMRLGKSAQAVRAAERAHRSRFASDEAPLASKVGVICPASVVPVWHEQFAKWWPESQEYTLTAISYDKAARGALDAQHFDMLILDEAHYLKSKDAARTKKILGPKCDGVHGLIARADKVVALTGTPTPNHPGELWPLLHALAPETIQKNGKTMSYWSFITTYCTTKDNGFGLQITGGKNLEKLRQAIKPFVLRRRYEDVAKDMPPLQFDMLPINGMAPDEGELRALLKGCESDDEIIKRLQSKASHVASLRRLVGLAKVKGVVDWYCNWHKSGGGKIVFFAHHKDVIEGLMVGLASVAGCGTTVKIDGSMAQHERAASVIDFREKAECVCLVGQLQAAGTGIDLSTADTAIFVESDWVPGNNLQAAMRIQKVGKLTTNQIWSATLPGSIDEKISSACLRKMRDSVEVFG